MGFAMRQALVLVQLSLLCFTVFGEDIEIAASPPVPPHIPGYHHPPAMAPSQPPTHHHHNHHHHSHPPSPSPPYYPPIHPPKPHSLPPPPVHPPVKPPPPAHPPVKPPPPAHPPVKPPPPKKPLPPAHSPVHPPPPKPLPPPARPPTHPLPRSFVAVQGVVYCKSCKYAGADTLWGATPVLGATVKLQCNNTKYPLEVKSTTDKNGYFFLQAPKTITNYGAHKCKMFLITSPNAACSKPSNLNGGVSGAILRPEKSYIADKLPFVLFTVGPFAFEPKCPR